MAKSEIEWTEFTWNPVVGCRKASPGCEHCYAERMAQRLTAMGVRKYRQQDVVDGNGWTGKSYLSVSTLESLPRQAKTIFVCSMSDLFYEGHTTENILAVYSEMAYRRQHTFLVLTKRPERIVPVLYDSDYLRGGDSLSNVWHGTSVENQEWADKRIPELRRLREYGDWNLFVSAEPLLGPIEFLDRYNNFEMPVRQVLIGCESGPNRRECKQEWIRDLIEQGKGANVPVFVKQISIAGRVSHDPLEWPKDLRLRELAWTK